MERPDCDLCSNINCGEHGAPTDVTDIWNLQLGGMFRHGSQPFQRIPHSAFTKLVTMQWGADVSPALTLPTATCDIQDVGRAATCNSRSRKICPRKEPLCTGKRYGDLPTDPGAGASRVELAPLNLARVESAFFGRILEHTGYIRNRDAAVSTSAFKPTFCVLPGRSLWLFCSARNVQAPLFRFWPADSLGHCRNIGCQTRYTYVHCCDLSQDNDSVPVMTGAVAM